MAVFASEMAPEASRTPAQIISKYADDPYCLELLRFFGTYPVAKFCELSVIHALSDDDERSRIRSALGRLIIDGVVLACIENGTHLYQLTSDELRHQAAVNLAAIDWHRWRAMLKNA